MDTGDGGPTTALGPELRRLRLAAALSLEQLARKVYFSRGHLCKIENGRKTPSEDLVRKLDVVLRTGGALARLLPDHGRPEHGRPDHRPARETDSRPARETAGGPEADPVDWAIELAVDPDPAGAAWMPGGARVVTGTTVLEFPAPTGAGWIDPGVVRAYRETFDRLRDRGQLTGPAWLIPTLLSETAGVRALGAVAGPDLRPALYRLASRFAEFAGWMAQEAGDVAAAVRLTDLAVRLAREAGDDLTAFRLVRLADIAMYAQDARTTITLAGRAVDLAAEPRVRGLAAQRLAHGHALANDRGACLRWLDTARALLSEPTAVEVSRPVMGSSRVVDHGAMAEGWCRFELGQPREAADILAVEIRRLPPGSHRASARYGTRLARCYADLGEIEQACATAEPILRRLTGLQSATADVDVAGLARTLRRYHRHRAVRSLMPLLAEHSARHRRPVRPVS